MGIEWGTTEKEMLRENNRLYLFVIVILVVVSFFQMYRNEVEGKLPHCQEDEYLYPVDYKGPGDNVPGDYKCVHIDEIRSN